MRKSLERVLPILDLLVAPFVYPSALIVKLVRRIGVQRFPICKSVLLKVGVFPILDHYFEPQFNYKDKADSISKKRELSGINWNTAKQLQNLTSFTFSPELEGIPNKQKAGGIEFYFNNGSFESGDAEFWYQLIRVNKPKRIIEVGSGFSTLMAIRAVCANQIEEADYSCEHVCIEPYEAPWLEETSVIVLREKIEDMDITFFSKLGDGDILFIDSSHIIRPNGDVLFEYLELLPSLQKGVIVHIHDIFSPNNYPKSWLMDDCKFWNEQYLLEAFLTNNDSWEIYAALNHLHHNNYQTLKAIAPYLEPEREPGSFYIQKKV